MTLERGQLQQTSGVNAKMASDFAGIARQATTELKKRGALVDELKEIHATELAHSQSTIKNRDTAIVELQTQIGELESAKQILEQRNTSLSQLLSVQGDELAQAQADSQVKDEAIATLHSRIDSLESVQIELREQTASLSQSKDELEFRLSQASGDLVSKDATITSLKEHIEHLESEALTRCASTQAEDTLPTPPITPPTLCADLAPDASDSQPDEYPLITPFPRRLPKLRNTRYAPRPPVLAGVLIRQAYIHCNAHVDVLPSHEEAAMADFEEMGWTRPAPVKWRPYHLRRDVHAIEHGMSSIPRPVEVEWVDFEGNAETEVDWSVPMMYVPQDQRQVKRDDSSRIPVFCLMY